MQLREALSTLKKAGFIVENEKKISDHELAELIMEYYENKYKTKFTDDDYKKYMDVAHYIAAYYADMDASKNEMIQLGARALNKFIANVESDGEKYAFRVSRPARYSVPDKKIDWLEDLRTSVEHHEAEREEERRQAAEKEYKDHDRPDYRGPNGRWTLD